MQFVYHKLAGSQSLEIKGEKFKHLIKARRKKVGESLHARNLEDGFLYTYTIENINRNEAELSLLSKTKSQKLPSDLNLGWAVVDPKIIEKILPFLNEIGVGGINFVYTDFSQKNFKLDLERMERILINSSEQCGRTKLLQIKIYENLQEYLNSYPNSFILDFGGKKIDKTFKSESILVGCEGGFSKEERGLFDQDKILGLESPLILKSETAVCSLGAKLLL
ncbi:MAG: 16S rRNA (uracil(1498)-N(3))-methyltransferase [Proteobacteria bacterium]|nr:MAG: 16S rRNA (uracil(1498)-N(3))-methyltransferase [Pseudomonadota bacterium]